MSSTQDILDALVANLAQPKRARTDAGEVEQHALPEQVEAVKFAIAMSASGSPFRALRFAQTMSGNANGASDPSRSTAIYPPPGVAGLPGYPY